MKPTGKQRAKGLSLQQQTVPSLTRSQQRGGETIAVYGPNGDPSVSAEKNAEGQIAWQAEGKPPQGEAGTLAACSALVHKLNSEREEWNPPTLASKQDDDVDCECTHRRDVKKRLFIQVTRIGDFRSQQAISGAVAEDGVGLALLADEMKVAIDRKSNEIRDLRRRRNLVLALNTADSPQHSLTAVIREFRERHGSWAATLEFQSIWLIGPDSATTHCLASQRAAVESGEDGE